MNAVDAVMAAMDGVRRLVGDDAAWAEARGALLAAVRRLELALEAEQVAHAQTRGEARSVAASLAASETQRGLLTGQVRRLAQRLDGVQRREVQAQVRSKVQGPKAEGAAGDSRAPRKPGPVKQTKERCAFCDRPRRSRGLCNTHLRRVERSGHPLAYGRPGGKPGFVVDLPDGGTTIAGGLDAVVRLTGVPTAVELGGGAW